MSNLKNFKTLALSFPEAEEHKHFDNIAFKVSKKIFVTLNEKKNQACVKLSLVDQDVFALAAKSVIYPVPNKWGKQGWTIIELDKVKSDLLIDALTTAFCTVASKKLVQTYCNKLNDTI
ncbi:MAG TPA: MmcQ/YjbR family DNA-binding protein [Pedobacter sp.]|nr:MmcQ/YjbR family DNA-binding protein [Pedobacter sp.]